MEPSSPSIRYPIAPFATQRPNATVGNLVIHYHSALYMCKSLPSEQRYTKYGAFTGGTALQFKQPPFFHSLYPTLLSTANNETDGIGIILSMWPKGGYNSVNVSDWEGKYFSINTHVNPNELAFEGPTLDDWPTDSDGRVKVAIGTPKEDTITP